ncbi:hypothetical protein K9U40_20580, partial [Xanthobacter autotrophicus]|uniref:hypothetical protein n=1 Tax=Xanthobacter autotrophicus TaxID=280 RepID=UPI0024AA723B
MVPIRFEKLTHQIKELWFDRDRWVPSVAVEPLEHAPTCLYRQLIGACSFLSLEGAGATSDASNASALLLGSVDGFDEDEAQGEGDDGSEAAFGLLAAQGDALEPLQFSEAL